MRYPALCALLLGFSALSASAQPVETITVTASALIGTWTITEPSAQKNGGQPTPDKMHCRIEPSGSALALFCFERRNGRLDFTDGKLRILWSPTLAQSNIIEAQMTSPTSFAGRERVTWVGVTLFTRDALKGVKFTPAAKAADPGPSVSRLRTILAQLEKGEL